MLFRARHDFWRPRARFPSDLIFSVALAGGEFLYFRKVNNDHQAKPMTTFNCVFIYVCIVLGHHRHLAGSPAATRVKVNHCTVGDWAVLFCFVFVALFNYLFLRQVRGFWIKLGAALWCCCFDQTAEWNHIRITLFEVIVLGTCFHS